MKSISTIALSGIAATILATAAPQEASAQERFIGEIQEFPYNFCPRGWTEADGKLMSINEYQAMFSLLGTQYGGDGRTTFALPDYSAADAPASPQTGGEVRLYQHCGFGGWSQSAGLGNYGAGGFGSNEAFKDNDASSLRISGDWEVVLYDGPNQTGSSVTLDSDESCLIGRNFNDKVSSISVRRKAAPVSAAQGPAVRTCIATVGIFPSRN